MKSLGKYLLLLLMMPAIFSMAHNKNISSGFISNPIIPGYFADPSIIVYKDTFYIYATIDPWGGDSLALWVSVDFKKWERKPLNWPTKLLCKSAQSGSSMVWAPSVIRGKDSKFHMFVSVGSEVYAGISDHPEGPWKNVKADGSPFVRTQKNINVHTIDAEVFLDDDGKAYLYWGSGFNWKNGHCFVAALNEEMDTFTTTPKDITPPAYFEAPYMVKRKGTYFLMYSDGKCTDSTYKVRYSTAKRPDGPWIQGINSPVLSSHTANNIIGPGHHSILLYNKKYYIIYHRIASTNTRAKDLLREICIDELSFDNAGNLNIVKPVANGIKNFIK